MREFRYDDVPAVEIEAGKIQGYFYDGVYIFKGIPYAEAGRFQMPKKVKHWEGIRETCSYGHTCPMLVEDNPIDELIVPHRYWTKDENCLNLNVWTKNINKNDKKPVLVWLHGGGFSMGSSIEQVTYDGSAMCSEGDVIVVSVNHRLNILGFLDLSPYSEKYANSANAGLADLVAALEWVKENISNFGGDPNNVTLLGQSGGGMKIQSLMQMPSADGLFHKGVVMSGVIHDEDGLLGGNGDGRQIVGAILNELGIPEDEVERLESVPYFELAQAYNKVAMPIAMQGGYIGNAPRTDEYYVGSPLSVGLREESKNIPLIIGSTFGEFNYDSNNPYRTGNVSTEQEMTILKERYGENTEKVVEIFKKAYPEKRLLDLLMMDRFFRSPSKDLAKLVAKTGNAPAYLYNLTLTFPFRKGMPAWHCADIPFFFHNVDIIEICQIPNTGKMLEEQMFGSLMQFVKTGNPNNPTLHDWPAVSKDSEPTLILDEEIHVEVDYDNELLKIISELEPKISLMEVAMGKQH